MSTFSLKTGISRGSRIRAMIARELGRGGRGSMLRLMRMKALLLRIEERLAEIVGPMQPKHRAIPVRVRNPKR
ncbi:MAG TPA: hypothetical protein PK970_06385 [Hyphomicrobiaceae bacterium]|nr:hypothetical protein [Hyphomicrobiaceae bacterium]